MDVSSANQRSGVLNSENEDFFNVRENRPLIANENETCKKNKKKAVLNIL